MIILKRFEDAEFIMWKDELTYSAIIKDFKNVSQIHILTYNISKNQNVLLKVFLWIINSSSEYKTGEELLFLETAIRKSIAMFGAMYEEYYQMFYLFSDHTGIKKWYYNTTSSVLNTRDLEKVKEISYQYLELLKRVNKIFDLHVFYEKGIDNWRP